MPRYHLVLVTLGLAGCVGENADSTVVILQNQRPGEDCVIPATLGESYVSSGRIDDESRRGYVLTPVAQNNATSVEGQETQRMAFVEGARIDLHFPDQALEDSLAGRDDTRFEVPFAMRIDPDGGTASVGFEALPTSVIDQLSDGELVYIDVKLFGNIGGGDFESQTWRYPVEVCDDCIVFDFGPCSSLPTTFVPTNTGNACNPYQDDFVDCCRDPAGGLVCPAVGTMAALQ